MLIVLHTSSSLISYDKGFTCLGDSETIVSYSHFQESIKGYVLWLLRVNLTFNCIIQFLYWSLFSTLQDALIAYPIYHKVFLHWKVIQSFLLFWVNEAYVFLSQCKIFVSSTRWVFISSPMAFLVSRV